MKGRWAVAALVAGLAAIAVWVAVSHGLLAKQAAPGNDQKQDVGELQAEALRVGGLRAAAKVTGRYVREIPGFDLGGPSTIAELVGASSHVLVGRVLSNRSRLDPAGETIRSSYEFDVQSLLKGERAAIGRTVQVVLLGGRVIFDDGSLAELRVADAVRPIAGERYMLFLKRPTPQPPTEPALYLEREFVPVFDIQGLYRLPAGGTELERVDPVDRRGRPLAKIVRGMSPGQFIAAVQQAVRVE